MDRIPEAELMDNEAQAKAYALADFSEPHSMFIGVFGSLFSETLISGTALDLGCGPADISIRFAQAFPHTHVVGVDGAEKMLAYGHQAVARANLGSRIDLIPGYLPNTALPQCHFDIVLSNSLLHHLHDPLVMWRTIAHVAKPQAIIFVMDLLRPDTEEHAQGLVEQYAAAEPELLQRDFLHSLHAAYATQEVEQQLLRTGLDYLDIKIVSDRHYIVYGRLPQTPMATT